MANTSARMLRLLSLLQTHRYWPGTELADRLEVSPRTLRRDVDRLRELGYPVDAARGVAGGYQLQAGAAMPPLLLDDDEAVAIAVGLRTAAAGAVAGFEETSVRALAKVIQLLPPRLRRRIDALQAVTAPGVFGGGPTLDADHADHDRDGLPRRGAAALRLHPARRRAPSPATSNRTGWSPSAAGGTWWPGTWTAADWRSFRVDRLTEPALTGARFRPREIPGGDPVAWMRARIAAIPTRYEVSVARSQPPPRPVRPLVGHGRRSSRSPDDACRMRMNVDDLRLAGHGARRRWAPTSPSSRRRSCATTSAPPARRCCARAVPPGVNPGRITARGRRRRPQWTPRHRPMWNRGYVTVARSARIGLAEGGNTGAQRRTGAG